MGGYPCGHEKVDGQPELDLHTDSGVLTASSKKKPWKKTIPTALTEQDLLLLEGRGENILSVTSEEGNITLDTVKFAE